MSSILLIDVSHLFWTHWFGSEGIELSAAYERTLTSIHKTVSGFDVVVACCDGPPYLRKEYYPDYKGNRPEKPPVALEQLDRVKRRLDADGFLVLECRGWEADDLFATVCDKLRGKHEIVIGTSDKDSAQLVDDVAQISVLNPLNGNEYTREKVIAKFGVDAPMLGDLLALTGDAGDNIPGVRGIGPKTAAQMLLTHGDLDGVIAAAVAGTLEPARFRKVVSDAEPTIRLARKLVTLRTDAPIDVDEFFKTRAPKPLVETGMEQEMDEPLDAIGPEAPRPAADIVELSSPGRLNAALTPEQEETLKRGSGLAVRKKEETLATYQGPEFERGLEPATLDAAWRLAGGIMNSRLYTRFTSREAIWAIIVRGREMGLGAMTALDMIHFFEGKPALHAHLIIARAKSHPDCEYFQMVESTSERARYACKRRGNPEPTTLTYTIEQARKAGLVRERGNWAVRPDEMLRKTCAVQLARVEFPEALLGAYAIEELGDEAA